MMAGRVFLVLTGAYQFGHGVGGFTTNFIYSFKRMLTDLDLVSAGSTEQVEGRQSALQNSQG